MKSFLSIFFVIALMPIAFTQIELISADYFPADLEFQELKKVAQEEVFEDPVRISELENGSLLMAGGCRKYARRVYDTEDSGSLSIEIATLADARSAYSLLTLLAQSGIQGGPPGEAFSSTADTVLLVKGSEWTRLKGRSVSPGLMQRVAASVSNRIASSEQGIPSLIAHLPSPGYDPSSLRYFPGLKIYERYSGNESRNYLKVKSDIEIAQAHYALEDRAGDLLLLSFPTPQVAEEYFDEFPGLSMAKNGEHTLFSKRVGPLVAVLEGDFDSVLADQILDPLKFEYSIRWIYDSATRQKSFGEFQHIFWGQLSNPCFLSHCCVWCR